MINCFAECWPFIRCDSDLSVAIVVLMDFNKLATSFIDDFDVSRCFAEDRFIFWSMDPFD